MKAMMVWRCRACDGFSERLLVCSLSFKNNVLGTLDLFSLVSSVLEDSDYKDHDQLLKLMQFVMDLNDVYAPLRSTILTSKPLPTVKEAFSLLPRDKSHRTMHAGRSRSRVVPLLLIPGLMITKGMFELIGYPPNFKKKGVTSQNVVSNGSVNDKDTGTGAGSPAKSSFASHHITFTIEFLFNIIDVSPLNIIVAHPNGTIAKVNLIRSCKVIDKIVLHDVLVVLGYQDSLLKSHAGTGSQREGIYFIDLGKKFVNRNITTCLVSKCMWHNRLRHPANQVLSVLKDNIDLKGFQSSEPCEVAKQTKDPFLLSEQKTNDNSRAVWLFLVKGKDERFAVLSGKCPYELVYKCQSSLSHLSEPIDDERDNNDGGGTNPSSAEPAVESASADLIFTIDPFVSTSNKSVNSSNASNSKLDSVDKLGSIIAEGGVDDYGAALCDDENISEGEGLDLYNFDMLKDYVVDGKVKYGINTIVNYSNLSCDNFSFVTSINNTYEPKSFKDVVLDSIWVNAINSEIEALNRNNTWVITDLPKGRKPIRKRGIDYEETFSPVVKMVTIRCVLSLAVQNNWNVYKLDINNAFLYGELDEDVYMSLPEGYFSNNDRRVCKLQKSLYELK
ncbi:ribonuclease H-like domain-containing protein [Tanacetum coccineum]